LDTVASFLFKYKTHLTHSHFVRYPTKQNEIPAYCTIPLQNTVTLIIY